MRIFSKYYLHNILFIIIHYFLQCFSDIESMLFFQIIQFIIKFFGSTDLGHHLLLLLVNQEE